MLSERNGSVEIGDEDYNKKKNSCRPSHMSPLWQTRGGGGGVALTDYAPIRLDTEGINRVWRDLHGAVHSNAACFGDDIILITSHTG